MLVATAGNRGGRARALVAAGAMALLIVLCLVPFPFHTSVPAVVWLPEKAHVRPETDGFVTKILARDGTRVEEGDVLLVLEDPMLAANRERLASQLERLRTDNSSALLREPLRARNLEEEIERTAGELKHVEEKIGQLELRAQVGGTLVIPRQDDLPGVFAKRGRALGYILDGSTTEVRATVPEHDAALVRERMRGVEVRLAEAPAEVRTAQLVREVPAATNQLPSAALGDRGGGRYPVDPADKDGLRTVEPVVLVDLKLAETSLQRAGGRAWVRFDHGAEPLAGQWYRRLRQLFLRHFDPTR